MLEVKVQSLGLDRTSNTPVVILQEKDGSRVLPIWIGPGEASAIAMELAGMKFSRPLTHDLFASVIKGLGGQLKRVMITKVIDNTYYAELIVQRGNELISIDARPSDTIAIGLRFDSPIYTYENILAEAGIVLTDEAEEDKPEPKAEAKVRVKKETSRKDDFKNYSIEKLNDLLKDAIDKEDYERAAKIRDELSKRN